MVHQGARHLVLMGRRGASTPAAQDAVQAMQAAGAEVTVAAADVADAAQLAKVLDDIRQSRPPLGGIMHTAGILDDGILLELDQARFRSVMAPKVEGSWNLHTQTLDTPLDFFVLFSSAVSLLGSPGQANYSAACAFLDALAHHRRALGLPALTVNWGVWSEVGLAASPERGGRLVSLGFGQMTPTQGVDALGHVLGHNASQLAVLPINWPVWRQAMQPVSDLPVFESLMREHAASGQNTHATVIRETLSAAQPGERQRVLEEYVLAQVAKVLGLAPAKLDVQQPLNKVGLDSLMAVEVKNRIELDLGVVIPTVELLEGPTIVQLAARVLTQLPTAPDARPSEPSARPQAGAAEQPALAGTISRVEANEMLAQVDQLSAEKVETLLQKLLAEEQQEEKRKP